MAEATRKPSAETASSPASASAVAVVSAIAIARQDNVSLTESRPDHRAREGMSSDVRTLCDIFLKASASGKPDLLISKVGGKWTPIAAADFGYTVRALSLGLNALGIQPGDRVAILSENRPEWAMADYAILCAGAWSVPVYPTLPAAQVAP